MKCLKCEEEEGIHRAVVDLEAHEVIGGLCLECEQVVERAKERKEGFVNLSWRFVADGEKVDYAAPLIDLLVEDGAEDLISYIEYDITYDTPLYRREHLFQDPEGLSEVPLGPQLD